MHVSISFEGVCETHVILIPGACGTGGLNCSLWTVSPGPPGPPGKFQEACFCTQARYSRAIGLRWEFLRTFFSNEAQNNPKASPKQSQGTPKTPQCSPRWPKVRPKIAQGAPKRRQMFPKEKQKGGNAGPKACFGI